MAENDIDEISMHIQKIMEKNSTDSSKENNDTEKISSSIDEHNSIRKENQINPEDLENDKNLIEKIENFEDAESISIMKPESVGWTDESIVSCDLCNEDIELGKNLSGLVISDEFFACEECCQKLTKEELMEWSKSKMVSANDVRPIGLWVIQQQRKD